MLQKWKNLNDSKIFWVHSRRSIENIMSKSTILLEEKKSWKKCHFSRRKTNHDEHSNWLRISTKHYFVLILKTEVGMITRLVSHIGPSTEPVMWKVWEQITLLKFIFSEQRNKEDFYVFRFLQKETLFWEKTGQRMIVQMWFYTKVQWGDQWGIER